MKTRLVDVKIQNPDGSVVFQRDGFEVPAEWSDRAATIVASKYAMNEENSVLDIIERITEQLKQWGLEQKYFVTEDISKLSIVGSGSPLSAEEQAEKFKQDLEDILINQRAAFNSPVWFNVGVKENDTAVSACFLGNVEDNMESILDHFKTAGLIFKNGSGIGVNISKIRAEGEQLSNKGKSSGVLSFLRSWDKVAGTIKSGGRTRRSAVLIGMEPDHPDVEKFIACKSLEEKKAKDLISLGYPEEEAYATVDFQNANHSIAASDVFMNAVKEDKDWMLVNRGNKEIAKKTKAKELFHKIAKQAWETGDPGMQFLSTINNANPIPNTGAIKTSNPCGEIYGVPYTACNLCSLNLLKYQENNDFIHGDLDIDKLDKDINTLILAMDIMIDPAYYATDEFKKVAIKTRPLGLGLTNLGAYLMRSRIPYGSVESLNLVDTIYSYVTGMAVAASCRIAKIKGPYAEFENNKSAHIAVIENQGVYISESIKKYGLRNSQVTTAPPCGTVSFVMDADSTGIEPLFALKTYKQLSGGGFMEYTAKCVKDTIEDIKILNPDYEDSSDEDIIEYFENVFRTANDLTWKEHIDVMVEIQKRISSGISKTVNLPNNATVEEVEEAYMYAWEKKCKGITIYRDGSKSMQPITDATKKEKEITEDRSLDLDTDSWSALRRKLPDTRQSITHKFNVGGLDGYLTVGMYEDGTPGEIFIRTQKQGSTMQGVLDAFATAVSMGLQYGVPIETMIEKFVGSKFEPAGFTPNEEIRYASSPMDYMFKWISLNFIDEEDDTLEEQEVVQVEKKKETPKQLPKTNFDGPPCSACGSVTSRNGTCFVCTQCGETTGCS
jgi:ribonucleoside-diphosphate reductase alpha chain